jgi:hypothetical protein
MNTPDKPVDLDELILQKLDGTIKPADYERLVRLMESNPDVAAYYVDFTMLYVGLSEPGKITFGTHFENTPQNYYNSLLAQLAENEKIALKVDVPNSKTVCDQSIGDIQERKEPVRPTRQISPLNLWTAIGAIAALVFVVIYPRLMPEKVAVLTDAIDARWSSNTGPVKGDRLYDDKKHFILQSGLAKISFDFGAEVILEGPAEFSLISEEKMFLKSGRVFARVPTKAVGFVVDTPSAGIIDLGTEFGVQVETDGSSQVHLFKGQASLMAGVQGARRNSQILEKGSSRRVNQLTSSIEIIPQDDHYVRQIDSSRKFVWRGQPLNLADMVGSGNGFGTGVIGAAINPVSGQKEMLAVPMPGENEGTKGAYIKTPWNAYIDGVFVPDGSNGPVIVSSRDHVFASCPDTSGTYWTPVSNGGLIAPNQEIPVTELILNGKTCGNKENPSIFMHSNLGITFNLEAIRTSMPNVTIMEFSAACGVSENTPKPFAQADFWVLVDGKVRFGKTAVNKSQMQSILVPISDQDQFLTLIVTDGGPQIDPQTQEKLRPIDCDWGVFLEPRLKLKAE